MTRKETVDEFDKNGFEILKDVFPPERCDALAGELSAMHHQRTKSAKTRLGGVRNLLRLLPRINDVANSSEIMDVLKKHLTKPAFPVRALFFDKTADANWRVAWHQDLTIAVAERIETPEFEAWSIKEEIHHVHPPTRILEGMATVRLHLDDCHAQNGALKVIPGSHLEGKLNASQIKDRLENGNACVCEVPKGGAMLMRPLLLHASSPAENPSHRRVLHIEYATDELPNGLRWFERQ
ncbi:MAG TPA: phytanoyl-CoA dioxygenase family protein [Candidatus Sulfotelmatobacter sp.]|nr:phytanoyl-CoA dioxygenase family protein [Candidatus Sulfotelmatobacter sp.]